MTEENNNKPIKVNRYRCPHCSIVERYDYIQEHITNRPIDSPLPVGLVLRDTTFIKKIHVVLEDLGYNEFHSSKHLVNTYLPEEDRWGGKKYCYSSDVKENLRDGIMSLLTEQEFEEFVSSQKGRGIYKGKHVRTTPELEALTNPKA